MESTEHVGAIDSEALPTSLAILFVALPVTAKGPAYRVLVSLPKPLDGLVTECAIFAEDDKGTKTYTVTLPGGSSRFPALKAEKQTIIANGKTYRLQDDDPIGLKKLGNWEPQIKTALHAFMTTGNPEQRISL